MPWPRDWLKAARPEKGCLPYSGSRFIELEYYTADEILTRLGEVGALKDAPQFEEIWWCKKCKKVLKDTGGAISCPNVHESAITHPYPIKMREVMADES